MPRLPRQHPRRPPRPLRPKRATGASPVPLRPRLARKVEVDVTKYHACHVKRRWMSPSATPATPTAAATPACTPAQARHRSQSSAISATPATQSGSRCHQVSRLPRETQVDVFKCHACHANSRGDHRVHSGPSAATGASAKPATQSGSRCHQVCE